MPEFTGKFDFYRALAGADLTDAEFRLLVLMANYADGTTGKRIRQSFGNLAADLGKNVKTVKRTVPRLIAKDWLYLVEKRPGTSDEYGLSVPTGDTQMSPVTSEDRGHSDVPTTGDISEGGGDTQMSPHRGHPDVPRSDQIRSLDQTSDQETPTGSLAVAVEHPTAEGQPSGAEPEEWRPEGLSEPASAGSSAVRMHGLGDPFASQPAWLADSRQHAERAAEYLEPATAGGPPAPAWD
ncbi:MULTISPECIES: helix-turn-helix domain-containing protein [Mycolicibacterium]|uniref:Helix-turn-helix domain-containing protein n=1 Tax=Mycolicibacterium senegalense TaxID=1796 RepID=A0ABR5G202_9MYCO|nr:hypothetical protein AA982_32075 [Mycolicibacterium senegalense]KLO54223.1 hypothetical protein ABW05_24925 [Mycolicibacterium senegalense]OBK05363.1 hypothetical protein A5639_18770 [Mycolicibacterium conceptionense]OMB78544.1 hypothetical protein A5746_08300 [Mycolicibacterium conceptionense]OMB88973.1 hypothetical protein A5741_14400 [Mycolicibacterium conceptionense]